MKDYCDCADTANNLLWCVCVCVLQKNVCRKIQEASGMLEPEGTFWVTHWRFFHQILKESQSIREVSKEAAVLREWC